MLLGLWPKVYPGLKIAHIILNFVRIFFYGMNIYLCTSDPTYSN